ncbi:hypothetical protein [Alkalibacterium pelagium]|uniref:Uncharacterized protein n=1 Tax=Alkalibacterium pelagium TaxID=426702 RepID=A0A1H7MJY4_9LACT|nr:hypothetical protein [Alkalibacterium pelagium]GEN51154.1 hypothetical protein APE02nite_18190 [Alkalibacterium pelagium]SEL11620.1 hypothetical protein SAMN04488099_1127 [Alkalibacterium pelagium]
MSKRYWILAVAVMGLGLSACQQNEAAEEEEVAVTIEEPAEDAENDGAVSVEEPEEEADEFLEHYQSLLDQSIREYEADQLDAAAGTLSLLLENDLEEYPELREEAEGLLEEIKEIQAQKAAEVAEAQTEESRYKEERQSALYSDDYFNATGQSMEEASDEELDVWFAQKAEAEEESDEAEHEWTKEEAENYAFDQLMLHENLAFEKYIYFVNQAEQDWVNIEVREPVEQDGVAWSNMIGIYRFNVSTNELQKLDTVTGQYSSLP